MTHKLLLADDSTTIRRVIELTFSGEDIDVVSVDDGEQAIERIPIEKPDIVLADISIPKRSGYDVAAFVNEQTGLARVPVLLLAGAFDPVDDARLHQVKPAGVVVKPFEPHLLVARVRELIEAAKHPEQVPVPWRSPLPVVQPHRESTGADGTDAASPPPPHAGPAARLAEPALPTPQIGGARVEATSSLDDYFDRLDAAFATLGTSQSPRPPAPPADTDAVDTDVPTIDDVLDGASLRSRSDAFEPGRISPPPAGPAEAPSTLASSPPRQFPGAARRGNGLADLFALLFAVEQGEADATSLRTAAQGPFTVTDELVDRVAERVLQRLGPDAVRDVVEGVVSDIAERLVREEIDRIRRG